MIDADTLEFEMNVEGLVSSGGLGGPAILPLSLAKMSEMTRAFPEKSFSGIGGISRVPRTRSTTSCSAAAPCRCARPRCSTTRSARTSIKRLIADATEFFEKNASKGWRGFADIVGLRRERVVPHSQIKRPDSVDYQGGHEPQEGYAEPPRPGGPGGAAVERPPEGDPLTRSRRA